jgi:hypothetical protein
MKRFGFAMAIVALLCVGLSGQANAGLAQYHSCSGTDPQSNELYIYEHNNYINCRALYVGFYPYPGEGQNGQGGFGLPNDSISSYKAGNGVRGIVFEHTVYGGDVGSPLLGYAENMYSGWNDRISSIRVVTASRALYCDDLQYNEFALFRPTTHAVPDCVVLNYSGPGTSYPNAESMGIANDSVTAVLGGPISSAAACRNGGFWAVTLYKDANLRGITYSFNQGAKISDLGSFNGIASSAWARLVCNP